MEPRLRPQNIADLYGVGIVTARKYMRQMEHTEKPLTVTKQAVEAWEMQRTYDAGETLGKPRQAKTSRKRAPAKPKGKYLVPRVRPA